MKTKLSKTNKVWLLTIFSIAVWVSFVYGLRAYAADYFVPRMIKTIEAPVIIEPVVTYAYNEQVPEDVILEEMISLAERFKIDPVKWEKILRCEATCIEDYCVDRELDNLAKNKISTAVGLGQYLINTWYETESWKQLRKARTDYKAALWEMALDLANGEQGKWQECLAKTGVRF